MVQTSTSSIVYLTKWLVNVGPLKLTNTTFFLRQWEIQMSLFLFRIGERLISQKQPFEEVTQAKTLTLVSLIEEYIQSFFVLHLFEHIVPSLCSEVVDIGPITKSVCFIFFFFFFLKQISGNCNTTILHTPEGYSYLYSYDCALVPGNVSRFLTTNCSHTQKVACIQCCAT